MREDGAATSENLIFFARSRVPVWTVAAFVTILVSARIEFSPGATLWPQPPLGVEWWVCAILALLCAIPRRIEVGAEGLAVSWLSTPRLIRYDEIVRAASLSTNELLIELPGGETIQIWHTLREDAPRLVLTRLWRAIAASSETSLHDHERTLLARNDRSTDEWARALETLSAQAFDYRSSLTHDRLWEILRHPTIEGEVRGAAAVALAARLDDASRHELHEIGRQSVLDPLRNALEIVAAAETPDDLHAALELIDECSYCERA